jgi:hypothetical protein
VYLTNYTDEHVVFRLSEKEKQTYWFSFSTYVPLYGIVLPRSTHALALTMKEQEEQFSTLVLESAIFGGASSPKFLNPLSQDEWHEIFEEAKMNAKTVQRMILEAVATDQRDITSEVSSISTRSHCTIHWCFNTRHMLLLPPV